MSDLITEDGGVMYNNMMLSTNGSLPGKIGRNSKVSKTLAPNQNSDMSFLDEKVVVKKKLTSNLNSSKNFANSTHASQNVLTYNTNAHVKPLNVGEALSIKNVTPELAAQVVKHFVLPMFDTDYKKGLRRKYGRLQAGMIGFGKLQKSTQDKTAEQTARTQDSALTGTVLGDLKLTEILSNELEEVRSKFDSMNEALEKA